MLMPFHVMIFKFLVFASCGSKNDANHTQKSTESESSTNNFTKETLISDEALKLQIEGFNRLYNGAMLYLNTYKEHCKRLKLSKTEEDYKETWNNCKDILEGAAISIFNMDLKVLNPVRNEVLIQRFVEIQGEYNDAVEQLKSFIQ